jgi:hypothetical protein
VRANYNPRHGVQLTAAIAAADIANAGTVTVSVTGR